MYNNGFEIYFLFTTHAEYLLLLANINEKQSLRLKNFYSVSHFLLSMLTQLHYRILCSKSKLNILNIHSKPA